MGLNMSNELEDFIVTEIHNKQVRKNLKTFAKDPSKFNIGDTVSFDLPPRFNTQQTRAYKFGEVIEGECIVTEIDNRKLLKDE
jgi:hypothetical protein